MERWQWAFRVIRWGWPPEIMAVLVAQAVPVTTSEWLDIVKTMGPWGSCLVAYVWLSSRGRIRSESEVLGLQDQLNRSQAQFDALLHVYQDQMLPALLVSADALKSSAEKNQASATQSQAVASTLAEMRAAMAELKAEIATNRKPR